MKILSRLAERIGKMFRLETANAAEAFGVKLLTSSDMDSALNKWNDIFTGKPPWKDAEDEIDTANVASLISNTRSKLTMLDIGIALSESPRTEYMQKVANNLVDKLSEKLPRAFALGGMMIKFNGASWDFIYPERFAVTEKDSNGNQYDVNADATIHVNSSNIQDYLDGKYGPINGMTLVLAEGNYEKIEFGRATAYEGSNTKYYLSDVESDPETIKQDIANHPNGGAGARRYVRYISDVTLKALFPYASIFTPSVKVRPAKVMLFHC
mgnify:CR=1 FL=1